MDKLNSAAYCLAFKKIFEKCEACNSQFLDGDSLTGIVVDWSDAQINGLHLAIGKEKAEKLLKGCKVHWIRSCQRVANKIASSSNKQREKHCFCT